MDRLRWADQCLEHAALPTQHRGLRVCCSMRGPGDINVDVITLLWDLLRGCVGAVLPVELVLVHRVGTL